MADTAEAVRHEANSLSSERIRERAAKEMLLNYAALLEAMEVRSGDDTPINRDFVQALKQHAEDLRRG